jgi:seryl-tRNA synthetase
VIDIRLVREQPEVVRASQRARGEHVGVVDEVIAADERRRAALREFEARRAAQKQLSKRVGQLLGQAKAGAEGALIEAEAVRSEAASLADEVAALESEADAAERSLRALVTSVPNVIVDGVPAGGADDYVVLDSVGEPRDFDAEGFAPRDHLELGTMLAAIDTERGAKVSGSRFYFLTGPGALLELGLLNMAVHQAVTAGFEPVITPTLVTPATMAGAGFLDEHADEVYRIEADDLYLTGTSEVALAGMHAGEILDLAGGPRRYAGWSACYRREAGSHGKDTRGIIRVHQFHKVEMFVYCRVAEAEEEHARLLAMEREMLAKIEVPYRVIDTAAGDLGAPAARKYDCEAWLPSQQRYLELSSTSNCTTFQARRLEVRERDAHGRTQAVATLNGTLATTRWLVAILENHQQADGSVVVPAALRPFVGLDVMKPVGRADG